VLSVRFKHLPVPSTGAARAACNCNPCFNELPLIQPRRVQLRACAGFGVDINVGVCIGGVWVGSDLKFEYLYHFRDGRPITLKLCGLDSGMVDLGILI